MVSKCVIDSYFNTEHTRIGDIEIMIYAYGLSVSFGSIVRSKYIGYNAYKGRRINYHSKPTPIHGTFHKPDLNYLYSRSHVSRLPQVVTKQLIDRLSQKVSYASKIIDPVIIEFIPNDLSIHLHICDHSIFSFCIIQKCIQFSNTSHLDNLDNFIRSVVYKFKKDICILQKGYHSKENNIKIQHANKFVQRLGMSDTTTCVHQFIYDEKESDDTQITQYFIMHVLGLCIKVFSYVAHMFYAWSFSHNTAVLITKRKKIYFLSLNKNTTVFAWGAVNSN